MTRFIAKFPLTLVRFFVIAAVFTFTLFFVVLGLALIGPAPTATAAVTTAGDPLPRIVCTDNYTATVYADGLTGPDGIAFDPEGNLFLAEEGLNRVSQVSASGIITPVLTGVTDPEGITFDPAGNLYVVEDIHNGRLVRRTPAGITETLATGLEAPEGVTIAADGTIYVTQSNLQYLPSDPTVSEVLALRTHVTRIEPIAPYTATNIVTRSPKIQSFSPPKGSFISFSDITAGSDGMIYVANEIAGITATYTTSLGVVTFTPEESLVVVDPNAPSHAPFVNNGLITVEGISTLADGGFPLYAAEEDTSGVDQLGTGRVSRISGAGGVTTFCTGFARIEKVVVGPDNAIYISEDETGTLIRLASKPVIYHNLYLPLVTQ